MKQITSLLLLFIFLSGCSLLKKGETQQKMANKTDDHVYALSSQELKVKLIEAFQRKRKFDAPLLVTPHSPADMQRDEAVLAALQEQGFVYKNKLYIPEELEIGLQDFMAPDMTNAAKKKVQGFIMKAQYHVIEDGPKEIVIVEGSRIYRIVPVGAKSRLKVDKMGEAIQEQLAMSINWSDLLSKRLTFSSNKGPVNLEKSLPFIKPDIFGQLEMVYMMDPPTAELWEKELSAP